MKFDFLNGLTEAVSLRKQNEKEKAQELEWKESLMLITSEHYLPVLTTYGKSGMEIIWKHVSDFKNLAAINVHNVDFLIAYAYNPNFRAENRCLGVSIYHVWNRNIEVTELINELPIYHDIVNKIIEAEDAKQNHKNYD